MKLYEYRGYVIYPTPYYVAAFGFWKLVLNIRYGQAVTSYSTNTTCFTAGEAVFACIKYGKELIDGGVVMLDEAV